jgi:DNA-binding MarR family transcriptional regulator
MDNHKHDQHKRHHKDTGFKAQERAFYEYLKHHIKTATQVTEETGILQKNITRFKRNFEKAGRLWEVKKIRCPITRRLAWTLTTDPDKAPKNDPQRGDAIQLTLFPE